jgi:hypothetical protein
MSLISQKTKKDFLEESTSKNIKQLGKSSNTTVNGYSLYDSIRYASITGALSTTRICSRLSVPTLKEVLDYDNVI